MNKRTNGMVFVMTALAGCSLPSGNGGPGRDPAPGDEGSTGTVQAALTLVPAGVVCLRIVLSGSTSATESFAVVANTSSTVNLGPLTPGSVTITANAFNIACGSLTKNSVPSWVSDGTSVNVSAGLVSNVSLTLRPNVPTTATVDFAVPAMDVAAGGGTSYAVMQDGTVRAWGNNAEGELGDGTAVASRFSPVAIPGITNAVQVTAGGTHTCALLADGTARCWGANSGGELGNGTMANSSTPVAVSMPAGVKFAQLSAGGGIFGSEFTCAVDTVGGVWCWGANDFGQLGSGVVGSPALTPQQVAPGPIGLAADEVRAGFRNACARMKDGGFACWGTNLHGEFGDTETNPTPTLLPIGAHLYKPVVALGVGIEHSCGLHPTGSVSCSGFNGTGVLGDGTKVDSVVPTSVVGLTDAIAISVGISHNCAVRAAGTVVCWGDGRLGDLGDGNAAVFTTPETVLGLSGATSVGAGYAHTCARKSDGSVWCWGDNSLGQLGDSTNSSRFVPVKVAL